MRRRPGTTLPVQTNYPSTPAARTRWIVAQRRAAPSKNRLDPSRPYAYMSETEISPLGTEIPTATIFLTNRECPYRCLMCDLWMNTTDTTVPSGAIAAQIRHALEKMPEFGAGDPSFLAKSQVKLYNAGSFADPKAIPHGDYAEISETVAAFGRVVVECHPALIGPRLLDFQGRLNGRFEVAIGLETAQPETLDKLNKRFTLAEFKAAAALLQQNQIDLRVFLLLNPPFMDPGESVDWAKRSLDVSFDAGASTCCMIPTRAGNGAMEQLAADRLFIKPTLSSLEETVEYGIRLGRGRVFADLWDAEQFYSCTCSADRVRRLETMNRTQSIPPPVHCESCTQIG